MLEKLAELVRKIPLYRKVEALVWGLPQPFAAILTALGHALLTAITGPFAPITATLYTVRELRAVKDNGYTSPEYDHVSDIVAPWSVVLVYAFLVGTWV